MDPSVGWCGDAEQSAAALLVLRDIERQIDRERERPWLDIRTTEMLFQTLHLIEHVFKHRNAMPEIGRLGFLFGYKFLEKSPLLEAFLQNQMVSLLWISCKRVIKCLTVHWLVIIIQYILDILQPQLERDITLGSSRSMFTLSK